MHPYALCRSADIASPSDLYIVGFAGCMDCQFPRHCTLGIRVPGKLNDRFLSSAVRHLQSLCVKNIAEANENDMITACDLMIVAKYLTLRQGKKPCYTALLGAIIRLLTAYQQEASRLAA